jgi:hypothetical protein
VSFTQPNPKESTMSGSTETTYKGFDLNRTGKAMHEALSKTSVALGQSPYDPWETAPESDRVSSMNTVKAIIDNPAMSLGETYRTWARGLLNASPPWQWAEVKDKPNRKHPMLPKDGESVDDAFQRLPWAEQIKDHVALSVVLADLRAQGLLVSFW